MIGGKYKTILSKRWGCFLAFFGKKKEREMRNIKALLEKQERVWFYVSDEWKKDFYDELMSIDAKFVNGDEIMLQSLRSLMGVNVNGTVGYVSGFVWHQSFFSKSYVPMKVDYEKYRCGDIDFNIVLD